MVAREKDVDDEIGDEVWVALLLVERRHPIGPDEREVRQEDGVRLALEDVAAFRSDLPQVVLFHERANANQHPGTVRQ